MDYPDSGSNPDISTKGLKMEKEEFLKIDITKISQVYDGKNGCRCGCGGNYIATSYMINPRNKVNNKLVEKRLIKAKELITNGAEYTSCDTYFDISISDKKVLCFYFDELNEA